MSDTVVWAASIIARHLEVLTETREPLTVVSVDSHGQPWVAAGGEILSRL